MQSTAPSGGSPPQHREPLSKTSAKPLGYQGTRGVHLGSKSLGQLPALGRPPPDAEIVWSTLSP